MDNVNCAVENVFLLCFFSFVAFSPYLYVVCFFSCYYWLVNKYLYTLTLSYPLASTAGRTKNWLAILCSAWLDIELVP